MRTTYDFANDTGLSFVSWCNYGVSLLIMKGYL